MKSTCRPILPERATARSLVGPSRVGSAALRQQGGGLARIEVQQGILDLPVTADLEVHVMRGGAAGTAHGGDRGSGLDTLADTNEVADVVGVEAGESVTVRDPDHVA